MKENKYLFTYYVGANNRTGVVERDKLLAYLTKNGITGCTVRDSVGIWEGNQEQSVAVEIIDDETLTDKLVSIKTGMCELLEQKAILLTRNPVGVTW